MKLPTVEIPQRGWHDIWETNMARALEVPDREYYVQPQTDERGAEDSSNEHAV